MLTPPLAACAIRHLLLLLLLVPAACGAGGAPDENRTGDEAGGGAGQAGREAAGGAGGEGKVPGGATGDGAGSGRDGKVPGGGLPEVGLISCEDRLFVDDSTLPWITVTIDGGGMDAIRDAIEGSDRQKATKIVVKTGTYRGRCLFVEDHLRSEKAPLWLKAEGPVQIDCTDGNGQAFGFLHVSWIAVDGFTFGPASGFYGDSGVHVGGRPVKPDDRSFYGRWEPSDHVIIRNNVMRNLNRGPDGDGNRDHYESGCCDGAKANQTEWVWYVGNTISRTARHGIDNVGVHHAAICRNLFFDLVGEGQGVEAKGGSWDVVIDGNSFNRVFHRALMLGGEGTNNQFMWPVDFPAEAYHVVARNNVIVNAADGGITFYGCWGCAAIANSVWFTPGYDLVENHDFLRLYPSVLEAGGDDHWGPAKRVGESLANKDCRVVGNVFGAAAGDLGCALDASPAGVDGLVMHHNVFWNGGLPLPECGEGKTSITGYPDAASLFGDPRPPGIGAPGAFPAKTADLRPTADSLLVGKGTGDPLAPTGDAAGKPRRTPPTIGAFEP